MNSTKQNFFSESNVLNLEFDEDTPQSFVKQNSSSPLNYTGIIAALITKIKKSEFGLELLGSFDYDKINSTLTFDNQPPIDSLSNSTNYRKTMFSATGKYNFNISDRLKLKSSVNISQNYTSLNNDKEAMFFINPKIGLTYKRTLSGVFGINYSFTNNLPSIYYLNENYILKNYRTFSKGLDRIAPIKSHNVSFRYSYKNYKNLFLINSFALYSFSRSNYGTENSLSEVYSFSSYKILNGGDTFSYNIGITRYLNNLPISVKLDTHQSWSNSNVIINNNYGKVKNYTSSYRLQGNTYLKIPLNFRFHFQYNYSNGQLNNQKVSSKYLETSLSSVLELSKKWAIEMTNDYYSITGTNFLFNNMKIAYNPQISRWSYMLLVNNLSNINRFSNIYITEYQESISRFKIVPRYIILNLKYRF